MGDAHRFAVTAEAQKLLRVVLVRFPPALAGGLAATFRLAGIVVDVLADEEEALSVREQTRPGAVLLYLSALNTAELATISRFAGRGDCGLLVMLTTDEETLRVASLDAGADDVLSQQTPFSEVAARVRAVYRRIMRGQPALAFESGGQITLEPAYRCLIGPNGGRTLLSEAEYLVLETLLDADGAPVSREWLGRVALRRPLHAEDRSIDQLVLKLRRKLSAAGASERTILSARRQGYLIPDPSRFRTVAPSPTPTDNAPQLCSVQE